MLCQGGAGQALFPAPCFLLPAHYSLTAMVHPKAHFWQERVRRVNDYERGGDLRYGGASEREGVRAMRTATGRRAGSAGKHQGASPGQGPVPAISAEVLCGLLIRLWARGGRSRALPYNARTSVPEVPACLHFGHGGIFSGLLTTSKWPQGSLAVPLHLY